MLCLVSITVYQHSFLSTRYRRTHPTWQHELVLGERHLDGRQPGCDAHLGLKEGFTAGQVCQFPTVQQRGSRPALDCARMPLWLRFSPCGADGSGSAQPSGKVRCSTQKEISARTPNVVNLPVRHLVVARQIAFLKLAQSRRLHYAGPVASGAFPPRPLTVDSRGSTRILSTKDDL